MRPSLPDSAHITVVATNEGDHAETIGVYVVFIPPAGAADPGSCLPNGVGLLATAAVQPREKISLTRTLAWQCVNPAPVDGQSWSIHAFADIHADDFSSCATVQQVLTGVCSAALADDDSSPADDSAVRMRPRVVAIGP